MKSRFKPLNQKEGKPRQKGEDKTDNSSDNIKKATWAPATRLATQYWLQEAILAVMVVPILSPERAGRLLSRSINDPEILQDTNG